MNPMIKVLSAYIDKGQEPIAVLIDDATLEIPKGIIAVFDDGTEVIHAITASDHREFYKWYVELSNWRYQRKEDEIRRLSQGS